MDNSVSTADDVTTSIKNILESIEREREREIIARRFGLYDRRETLEQIGELLGITRERVRQLEKAILAKLESMAENNLPDVSKFEKIIIRHLYDLGHVARISDIAMQITNNNAERSRAHIAFIATLAPRLAIVEDSDQYYPSVGIKDDHDSTAIKKNVNEIVAAIKKNNQPITIEALHDQLNYEHPDRVQALASISKNLANLNGNWGLTKWPTVNPKNIRDKIYVILQSSTKPMHFSDIASSIKQSDFKRRNVTTQAIHNELIKDNRFVLVGRGIYALDTWGFKKGTVADIISDILRNEGGALHRDEIIKRVLKHRQVKQTTILLNLQSKDKFKRVGKATYALAD
ncbi:MAG TPA: sigma factor-like helix-turn-helix DNA-binding protein [Patescibacteria group bacterium]|jgi:hypothetical protein|nr:sigma factor-like helix-turn-helix DNA-binding protein [Patescibacteria group bacterium]